MHPNPDLFYLRLAVEIAQTQSDDQHTQNGAVLVTACGWPVGAANAFPDGVVPDQSRYQRPTKYMYIEHAERNAIYTAARRGLSTKGGKLYCPWFACTDCARAIICAGITEVVGLAHDPAHGTWQDSIDCADQMFTEAGVIYRRLQEKLGMTILRDGKEIEL